MNDLIRSIFEQGVLGDSHLRSITWRGHNLILDFDLAGNSGKTCRLQFEDVVGLKIDFNYGDYQGEPLLFEASVIESEGWKVIVDAPPMGSLEFTCLAIHDVTAASPAA